LKTKEEVMELYMVVLEQCMKVKEMAVELYKVTLEQSKKQNEVTKVTITGKRQ
jgi:hypothetical protein